MKTYRAFFPFGGAGGGALGFSRAEARVMGHEGRFQVAGGFDFDKESCEDFEYFTGVPEAHVDVNALTAADVRRIAGEAAPDCVFLSPPCKGASGLLSQEKSETAKYAAMNELALVWIRLMLEAWGDAPPRLVLFENVPRLKSRAGRMLREVRRLLNAAGYACNDGFHDCGELGGLAQHRRRFLMVARHKKRVPPLLYQPPKRRVRACGEVLGPLPMPEDPAGGPMHRLPKISWLNWVRLALIPPGGDWRDLPGVLAEDEKRREKFKRHAVEDWKEPTGVVGGSGTNAVANVADPRVVPQADNPNMHWGKYAVCGWEDPAATVIAADRIGSGAQSVADPRISPDTGYAHSYKVTDWQDPSGVVTSSPAPSSGAIAAADPRVKDWVNSGALGVVPWEDPAGTIRGESLPSNGPFAVPDPRVGRFRGYLGVIPWSDAWGVVTGAARPGNGAFTVADPRVKTAFDHGYGVLPWAAPSFVVAGKSMPGNGAYSVADPRLNHEPRERSGAWGVLRWEDAAATITGAACFDNGRFAIGDPRLPDAPPLILVHDVRKPPSAVPIIIAKDGTWHRPLTTLELAVLQGFPATVNGEPLKLAGSRSSAWRERIGNAVPPPAAQAIAERMLFTLLQADYEAFALSGSDTPVWVQPPASEAA